MFKCALVKPIGLLSQHAAEEMALNGFRVCLRESVCVCVSGCGCEKDCTCFSTCLLACLVFVGVHLWGAYFVLCRQ